MSHGTIRLHTHARDTTIIHARDSTHALHAMSHHATHVTPWRITAKWLDSLNAESPRLSALCFLGFSHSNCLNGNYGFLLSYNLSFRSNGPSQPRFRLMHRVVSQTAVIASIACISLMSLEELQKDKSMVEPGSYYLKNSRQLRRLQGKGMRLKTG